MSEKTITVVATFEARHGKEAELRAAPLVLAFLFTLRRKFYNPWAKL